VKVLRYIAAVALTGALTLVAGCSQENAGAASAGERPAGQPGQIPPGGAPGGASLGNPQPPAGTGK
jgi:hypothetical protein